MGLSRHSALLEGHILEHNTNVQISTCIFFSAIAITIPERFCAFAARSPLSTSYGQLPREALQLPTLEI